MRLNHHFRKKVVPHFSSGLKASVNETELIDLAKKFSTELTVGDRVLLEGSLGAGKTTFAKAILSYFGIADSEGSPTFSLAHEYYSEGPRPLRLIHLDFFRIESESEIEAAGISSYFWPSDGDEPAIILAEWVSNWPPPLSKNRQEGFGKFN
jgi:tRNA threonylcarbamoyl adenosine modification protein YjeE